MLVKGANGGYHARGWYQTLMGGRVTHICVSKLTAIGSDNGLSHGRHKAFIWTNAGILLIGPLGANLSEILIENYPFHSRKCIWKWNVVREIATILSRPQCVKLYGSLLTCLNDKENKCVCLCHTVQWISWSIYTHVISSPLYVTMYFDVE